MSKNLKSEYASITKEILSLSREEYFRLRRSRRIVRIVAVVLLMLFFLFWFLLETMPFLNAGLTFLFSSVCFTAGCLLLYYGFTGKKYRVLSYVYFKKKQEDGSKSEEGSGDEQDSGAEADEKTDEEIINSRIYGCLLGCAVGDALGYPVEQMPREQINSNFGKDGVTGYITDAASGKALISDNTQMALFTAEGLLDRDNKAIDGIYKSCLDWYLTPTGYFYERPDNPSELLKHKELFERRSPDSVCLDVLSSGIMGTVTKPVNSDKGCSGMIRAVPVSFMGSDDILETDKLAIQAAAITHGHPRGFLPAGLLVHILNRIIYDRSEPLAEIIRNCITEFSGLFSAAPTIIELTSATRKAIVLAENAGGDYENIKELGNGLSADEALATGIYCAVRHSGSFSDAVAAAVNQDGNSSAAGAPLAMASRPSLP